MNIIEKILWRWQGKRKLSSDKIGLKYTAIRKLGEVANPNDFEKLLTQLADNNQTIRNAAALSIRDIISKVDDPIIMVKFQEEILQGLENAKSLAYKLSHIEIMEALSLDLRENVLAGMIKESQNDLQYAVIKSLQDTTNLDILDDVLTASETPDLVLRRIALQTWYEGVAKQPRQVIQEYITPRLHFLIRAAYELQTEGEFLREILSYADMRDLPHPKAYPDFMIRYITELLGNWEYDPEAYRSLHSIMVPSYFTFESQNTSEEQPYVML